MTTTSFTELGDILSSIHPFAPEAHIAGGAVRDLILNRPVKDIDLFVSAENALAVAQKIKQVRPFFVSVRGGDYFEWDPTIVEVAEYEGNGLLPINLISLNVPNLTIDKNLQRFDLGLCRVAHDLTGIIYTPEFWHDVDRKQFTVCACRNETQYGHTLVRYGRLKGKYDWPLVTPPEFQKFVPTFDDLNLGDLS